MPDSLVMCLMIGLVCLIGLAISAVFAGVFGPLVGGIALAIWALR